MTKVTKKKRLIEVTVPPQVINAASARGHGVQSWFDIVGLAREKGKASVEAGPKLFLTLRPSEDSH